MSDATSAQTHARSLAAVDTALLRLASFIEGIDPSRYGERIAARELASIGEHARHVIDMAEALHTGCHSGTID